MTLRQVLMRNSSLLMTEAKTTVRIKRQSHPFLHQTSLLPDLVLDTREDP
jgi:hypothetical protein